jgi:hypothetical protein
MSAKYERFGCPGCPSWSGLASAGLAGNDVNRASGGRCAVTGRVIRRMSECPKAKSRKAGGKA